MSEISSQTTLGYLSLTDHGTRFGGLDTTRNDNAHFGRASRLGNQLVQCFDIKERRFAQSLSSQRHTNTQIKSRLLSQPQQLSQHAWASSDLGARVRFPVHVPPDQCPYARDSVLTLHFVVGCRAARGPNRPSPWRSAQGFDLIPVSVSGEGVQDSGGVKKVSRQSRNTKERHVRIECFVGMRKRSRS